MKTSLQLAFSPGFYETDYESSDTAYYAIHQELDDIRTGEVDGNPDWTEDDLDFDYQAYEKDIIDNFIAAWKKYAPADVVESVEFDELDSPREYNFRNDRLFAFVTFKEGWQDAMRKFMEDNAEWLREKIGKQWSSRDGFISFMSNAVGDWYHFLFVEKDERYLGTMIGYMMEIEDPEVYDDLLSETMRDIYEGCYVLTPDCVEAA